MVITPYHRTAVYVSIQSGKPAYLVDIIAYGRTGRCECPHFKCTKEPDLKLEMATSPGTLPNESARCKHIKAARNWVLDRFLCELEKVDSDSPKHLRD